MRNVFFKQLLEQMRKDKTIFLVVADMGLGLVEPIQKEFPERFINVGIAEQNMIGISAGLCNAGFRPVCYTISNFLIQRCYEQIRNDICLHNYPVVLVGTSTGYDNGGLGPTHQVIDDIGCIKVFPYMNIYSPSTIASVRIVFEDIFKHKNPSYVRIGKGSLDLPSKQIDLNHMVNENRGSRLLVITHGTMLENCLKAVGTEGAFSLYCMNKIKPLEKDEISDVFLQYPKILVVEDHIVSSGLYNLLSQFLVESKLYTTELYSLAPPEGYERTVGDKNYFADKYGLTPEKIRNYTAELLKQSAVAG